MVIFEKQIFIPLSPNKKAYPGFLNKILSQIFPLLANIKYVKTKFTARSISDCQNITKGPTIWYTGGDYGYF